MSRYTRKEELEMQIQDLNGEINTCNEQIAFHHQEGDNQKEKLKNKEGDREKLMKDLRKEMGEKF